MEKRVGKVNPEEKKVIQQLFERKNGLRELSQIIKSDNTELYEKLIKDIKDTDTKIDDWWDSMIKKYRRESTENGRWVINFNTDEIILIS